MASTETYSLTGDFPNQQCDPEQLTREIELSSITTQLEYINVALSDPDSVDVVFESAISAPEKTTLDGIVAAHDGYGIEKGPDIDVDGQEQGDILYRGESEWERLPAGTDGYVLTTQGPDEDPVWTKKASGSGSGDVTGPATHGDNEVPRWNGVNTNALQSSNVTIDDSDNISGAGTFNGVTVESHANRHIQGGADEIDGDEIDIDFTPTNYTPTTGTPGTDVDHLAAHLRGIDNELTAGSGDVTGPGSSTDNAIVRFDGTTGKIIQNSVGILDDSGNISGLNNISGVSITLSAGGTIAGNISLSGGADGGGTGALTNFTTYNGVTIEDHSARHEDGGGDEISIAGLSGEAADAQKVSVSKNSGVTVGTRSTLNFIEGSNITLTIADDAGGNEVDITIASSGGGSSARIIEMYADQLDNPITSDWAVDDLAPIALDSNNSGLIVRLFDDTTEEGVGFSLLVPSGTTNMKLRFISRAETAPGTTNTVGLKLYERGIPDNAAVDAWSAGTQLTDISIPTNENWQYDEQTDTIANWGLTADQVHQFELTRVNPSAGTELSGDWVLLAVIVEFS